MRLRKVKTGSGSIAVQVIEYENRKTKILKHIGSAKTETEVLKLEKLGVAWIQEAAQQVPLFKEKTVDENQIFKDQYIFKRVQLTFSYEIFRNLLTKFNFVLHLPKMVQSLIIAQILENGSKRHLVRFLEEQMSVVLNLTRVYEWFTKYNETLKTSILKEAMEMAKNEFKFDFTFVFYDVTTLYFESFKEYDFQKPGFSKDNKSNQPQIVIGLVVTEKGFPIHYEIFAGNKTETKTFLPVVKAFKEKHNIQTLTVVADAAMFSNMNFEELKKENINYIVGARLASQSKVTYEQIKQAKLSSSKATIRIDELIVEYSEKRYKKDKRELDKQIERAKKYDQTKTSKLTKMKYLKNDKVTHSLNQELIDKNTLLLGLKGYTTDLKLTDSEIIARYRELVKIEHCFRMSKSDLEVRPIFHHKKDSIQNHILCCFVALCLSVYLEIKVKLSIKEIVHQLRAISSIVLESRATGATIIDQIELNKTVKEILDLSH